MNQRTLGKENNFNTVSYLRVIACLLVVAGHYCNIFDFPGVIGKLIARVGPVTFFFVIAGFLAYISLEKRTVKHYYKSRFLKIVPPYYISLVICIVFMAISGNIISDGMHLGWIRYFTFINMIIPSYDFAMWNNLYGFWTMGCFPFFYLVAPFVCKRMKSLRAAIMWFVFSVLLMVVSGEVLGLILPRAGFDDATTFVTLAPVSTFYLFMLGVLSAYAFRNGYVQEVGMFLGVFLFGMLMLQKNGYVLWGIAGALILLKPSVAGLFEKMKIITWVVSFLDRNSFTIYLLHIVVAEICVYVARGNNAGVGIISLIAVLALSEAVTRVSVGISKKLKC